MLVDHDVTEDWKHYAHLAGLGSTWSQQGGERVFLWAASQCDPLKQHIYSAAAWRNQTDWAAPPLTSPVQHLDSQGSVLPQNFFWALLAVLAACFGFLPFRRTCDSDVWHWAEHLLRSLLIVVVLWRDLSQRVRPPQQVLCFSENTELMWHKNRVQQSKKLTVSKDFSLHLSPSWVWSQFKHQLSLTDLLLSYS